MRTFEVEVTRTDRYIIKIDEDSLEPNLIEEYEKFIHKLHGDKIKALADNIGLNAMDNNNEHYEGIGFIKTDGYTSFGNETVKGIEIETDMIEDYDTEIKEIKG